MLLTTFDARHVGGGMAQAKVQRQATKAQPNSALHLPLAQRTKALLAAACSTSVDIARAIAYAAAAELWASLLKQHGAVAADFPLGQAPVSPGAIPTEIRRQACAFGADLAGLAIQDAVAELGRLYTHALPGAHRGENGIFYTPPVLVVRLLDKATAAGMDWLRGKAISPGCGGGQFLVEDARRMVAAMGEAAPAIVVASVGARLRGWDIDPFACWLSQLAVEAALLPQVIASGKRLTPVTECRDSLMDSWNGHEGIYDLVNENPAFGKVKDTPEIRERFARTLYGHPNVYGLFADVSLRLAKPVGGIVALLTPTSYLSGHYFKALRRTLAELARPVSIDIVESRTDVFPDVLQEVALSAFVHGRTETSAACSIVHVLPSELRVEDAGELLLPKDPEDPWIVARDPADVALVAAMQSLPTRLSDWGYEVSTGPLVWNRANKLGRLHDKPGPDRYPVVWAEAVSKNGRFALRYQQRGHKAFYEAKRGKEGKTGKSGKPSQLKPDPNLVWTSCLLLQRTTAKEQSRRLIGAVMPASLVKAYGAVAVENHLNMVRPAKKHPPVSLSMLAAYFASDLADRVMRCISGSVAVSATELEAMPLPTVDDLRMALAARTPESALRRLYGIDDGQGPENKEDGSRACKSPRTASTDARVGGGDP
jgi:adenine-specific DNA-methyltransferase